MNFYDNINNLVLSFKQTDEYKEYMNLKEKLKQNQDVYNMLKDFKDKQNEVQIAFLNGQDVSKEKKEEMENLYSIVIQNEDCRKILECEMKINIILADLQKSMGTAIEELVKFQRFKMWVKDVRNYDVDIVENEKVLYSGNINDAPDELKQRETKDMKISHKRLIIQI